MSNAMQIRVSGMEDYTRFGMEVPGRSYNSGASKWNFNGKEIINEIRGWYDYGKRPYNVLLNRPPTIDPLTKKYPHLSPYQFYSNNPIWFIDLDGAEGVVYYVKQWKNSCGATVQEVSTAYDVNGRTDGVMVVFNDLDNHTIQTHYTPDLIVPVEKYSPIQKAGNTLIKVGEKMDKVFYEMQGDPNANPDIPFPGRGMALGASVNGELKVGSVPVNISTSVEGYSSSENTAGFNGTFQVAPALSTAFAGEGSANLYFKIYHEELPTATDGLKFSDAKAAVEITASYSFFYTSHNTAENSTSFGVQYPPKTSVEVKASAPGVELKYTTKEKPLGNE